MERHQVVKVERTMYVPPPPPTTPGCANRQLLCTAWAEEGECVTNPPFMIGTREAPGACLLACGRCDLLLPG